MKILSLLTASLFSLTTMAASPSGVELKLDLEKGKTYSFKTTSDIQYFSDATLTEKIMSMNMSMEMSQKVLEKTSDGIHTLELTITRIIVDQSMGGMQVSYDSNNKTEAGSMAEMMAKQFGSILNNPITVKVNAHGEVIEKPAETPGQAMSLASLADELFFTLPKEEISKGSTWEITKEQESIGTDIVLDFKVTDISKKEILVDFKSENDKVATGEEGSSDVDMKTEGKLKFDPKTGLIRSNKTNQTIKGNSPQMGEFFMVTSINQELL